MRFSFSRNCKSLRLIIGILPLAPSFTSHFDPVLPLEAGVLWKFGALTTFAKVHKRANVPGAQIGTQDFQAFVSKSRHHMYAQRSYKPSISAFAGPSKVFEKA